MIIKKTYRAAVLSLCAALNPLIASSCKAASPQGPTDFLYDNTPSFLSSLVSRSRTSISSNDYDVVCDASTGRSFKFTSLAQQPESNLGRFVGSIKDNQLVYLEYNHRPAMDVSLQEEFMHLSLMQKDRVRACLLKLMR